MTTAPPLTSEELDEVTKMLDGWYAVYTDGEIEVIEIRDGKRVQERS
jgi:hypothetical protein